MLSVLRGLQVGMKLDGWGSRLGIIVLLLALVRAALHDRVRHQQDATTCAQGTSDITAVPIGLHGLDVLHIGLWTIERPEPVAQEECAGMCAHAWRISLSILSFSVVRRLCTYMVVTP